MQMHLDGLIQEYLTCVTEQWLLVAPRANPGMLEMFRDRDASPLRQMVPWAGEFAGKYLTAAVQVLRVTGDPRLRAWLDTFVGILTGFQDTDGYLGPWSQGHHLTNTNAAGAPTWDTWGHYHVMMGLMLWHEEAGDDRALKSAIRIADLLCRTYLGNQEPRLVDTGSTEMNLAPAHALCLLYRKTEDARYLRMAQQIVEEFGAQSKNGKPLAGDYLAQALAGKAFYETPKPRWESLHPIMALAELHRITGEDRYRRAFKHLWWSIAEFDRHNNGGFSSGEQATGNPYHLAPIETCCTIAWTALSVEMLKLTGDAIVADELELTLFNSILGMHTITGRWATYNTPMNGIRRASAHTIVFQAREGTPELNCCSVNAPRGFGMLSEWALMRDADGLVLNYYGPATLEADLAPDLSVTLVQETAYPLDGAVTLRVQPSRPAPFALKLRIPHWSAETQVTLNGAPVPGVRSGRYLTIDREWRAGDTLSLVFDMGLRVWPGERTCEGMASIYRGPLLLAYDHRYNLDLAGEEPVIRDVEHWDPVTCMLDVPPLDTETLSARPARWDDWLPPLLLLACEAEDGRTVHLCDFASAGAVGTPYRSWLPVHHLPETPGFTRANPLRAYRL